MKNQILSIFFYLLYLLAMVRPLLPIIEYELNYDYIATILCENVDRPYLECNGKCYLIDRLSETSKQSLGEKSIPTINIDDYPISPIMDFSVYINASKEFVLHQYTKQDKLYDMYMYAVLRPPINC